MHLLPKKVCRHILVPHSEHYVRHGEIRDVKLLVPLSTLVFKSKDPIFEHRFFGPFELDKDGFYEKAFITKLAELVDHDTVFLDIGANIGLDAMIAAQYGDPKKFYCFEKEQAVLTLLKKNNKKYANGDINIVEAFVGATTTEHCLSIDDFVEKARIAPSLIKMDIEGNEIAALKGMQKTLRDFKPKILIEFHPLFLRNDFHLDEAGIYGFIESLHQLGYHTVFNGHHYFYRSREDHSSDENWTTEIPNDVNFAIYASTSCAEDLAS